MTHPIFEPASRLWWRWQTKRAIAHLDRRLIEDAGICVERNIWDDVNISRRGYWSWKPTK